MIQIDFNSKKPIYKQIVDQILAQIKAGTLHPGDRLPTERELAQQLDIARGTVKKAYKELADNNIIEVIQGSGSYIHSNRDLHDVDTRRQALNMIDQMVDKLAMWNLSGKEIATLMRMSLLKKDPTHRLVRVALVDCNPESLSLFKRQLNYIPGVILSVILVDSIILDDDPRRLLAGFDLVITTATHYEQVSQSLHALDVRVLSVDMAPSRETIVSISTLPADCSIGIICQSNKFSNLIYELLEQTAGIQRTIPVHFETDLSGCRQFMKKKDAIIVSPDLLLLNPDLSGPVLEDYAAAGGKVIRFDYLIDRASLTRVEEAIDRLFGEKW